MRPPALDRAEPPPVLRSTVRAAARGPGFAPPEMDWADLNARHFPDPGAVDPARGAACSPAPPAPAQPPRGHLGSGFAAAVRRGRPAAARSVRASESSRGAAPTAPLRGATAIAPAPAGLVAQPRRPCRSGETYDLTM